MLNGRPSQNADAIWKFVCSDHRSAGARSSEDRARYTPGDFNARRREPNDHADTNRAGETKNTSVRNNSIPIRLPENFVAAVLSQERVTEAPHDVYRYPARFSPRFAREAIDAFTRPGDLVVDPFCGGGTTIIEAVALGRRAAGIDISALATFLARTKTSPLSIHDRRALAAWTKRIARLRPNKFAGRLNKEPTSVQNYRRNLPNEAQQFFSFVISQLRHLPKVKQREFVRLVLLSVGQWALDCRTASFSAHQLHEEFCDRLLTTSAALGVFAKNASKTCGLPPCRLTQLRRIINRSSEGSETDGRLPRSWLPAKLILTSPPYPGVHVLYHRWQIHGRKETPAPFWLTNQKDGAGEGHYGLGRRQEPELKTYYSRLTATFRSIVQLMHPEAFVVQLVAFSDPSRQLPLYLQAMSNAGLVEARIDCDQAQADGRLWRSVPSRKWYATNRGKEGAGKEVLLIHAPSLRDLGRSRSKIAHDGHDYSRDSP
jgi:hypothetical protein